MKSLLCHTFWKTLVNKKASCLFWYNIFCQNTLGLKIQLCILNNTTEIRWNTFISHPERSFLSLDIWPQMVKWLRAILEIGVTNFLFFIFHHQYLGCQSQEGPSTQGIINYKSTVQKSRRFLNLGIANRKLAELLLVEWLTLVTMWGCKRRGKAL